MDISKDPLLPRHIMDLAGELTLSSISGLPLSTGGMLLLHVNKDGEPLRHRPDSEEDQDKTTVHVKVMGADNPNLNGTVVPLGVLDKALKEYNRKADDKSPM